VIDAHPDAAPRERDGTLAGPALLLGLGLGGFLDGIVLHQLLQWHHMISSTERGSLDTLGGLEANTLADGVFHGATWLLTAGGLWWLWRTGAYRRPGLDRPLLGWMIVGWGLFNISDEILFHALLDLHHIREGSQELAYDLVFTSVGVVQVAVGLLLVRSAHARGAA
jgi:uncharacterized membrane protein